MRLDLTGDCSLYAFMCIVYTSKLAQIEKRRWGGFTPPRLFFSHGIVLRPCVVIAVHLHRTIFIQHGHQVLCHHKTLTHTSHRVARRTQHVCIGVNVTFGIFVGLFGPACFARNGVPIINMSPSDVSKFNAIWRYITKWFATQYTYNQNKKGGIIHVQHQVPQEASCHRRCLPHS